MVTLSLVGDDAILGEWVDEQVIGGAPLQSWCCRILDRMGATRTGGGAAEDRDQHGCHIAPELGLGMAYSLHRACDW
jgi:hypothetical protein